MLPSLLRIFLVYAVLCVVFAIYRLTFLLSYLPANTSVSIIEYLYAFFTGWRFDTLVIAFALLPTLLLCLVNAFPKTPILIITKINTLLTTFLAVGLLIFLCIDIYFYSFFSSHIDGRIFGIVQDSTLAVLKSVYTDFPIFKIFIGLLISAWVFWKIVKWIFNHEFKSLPKLGLLANSCITLLFLSLYFLGLRGTVKDKVLNMEESIISAHPFLNTLAVNGIYTFKESFLYLQYDYLFQDPSVFLGERSLVTLVAQHLDLPEDSIDQQNPLKHLIRITPKTELAPPNIVFIQMESWSQAAWENQQDGFNILGKLRSEMDHLVVFKHFMPCQNGTIASLEGILLDTPLGPVGQSVKATTLMPSSVLLPLKQNGYTTKFLTAGTIAWRNLNGFLPYQGFDKLEGNTHITQRFPKLESFIWGVPDGYMFDYLWESLQEESGNAPQFVYAMTITNHSPYDIPTDYRPNDLLIDRTQLPIPFMPHQNDFPTAFRYSCDQLAGFLHKFRNSPLSQNTIIIITGDHSVGNELDVPAHDLYYRYAVPLMMFIPPQYLEQKSLDTTQWASHQDIFPTLFHLALSETSYLHTGRNLLDKTTNTYAINSCRYVVTDSGGVDLTTGVQYIWTGNKMHLAPSTDLHQEVVSSKIKQKAEATNIIKQYLQFQNMTRR